jgi:stress-induced-phosphoprotein 1
MIEVMGVLMNVDLQAFGRDEEPPVPSSSAKSSTAETKPSSSPDTQPSASTSQSAKANEDVEMAEEEEDEDAREEKKLKAEAEAQKKTGSDAYRRRDFAEAAAAFSKAWEIWPKDITFLTNLSGE